MNDLSLGQCDVLMMDFDKDRTDFDKDRTKDHNNYAQLGRVNPPGRHFHSDRRAKAISLELLLYLCENVEGNCVSSIFDHWYKKVV